MMAPKRTLPPVCLLVAALLASCAHAKIHTSVVKTDTRALIPLADAFGFADKTGRIDLTIRNVGVYLPHGMEDVDSWEHFGFFLSPVEADIALEQDLLDSNKCILDDVKRLFTFADPDIQKLLKGNVSEVVRNLSLDDGGLDYLYFASCETTVPVSFTLRVEMYNLDKEGQKDYLSIGDSELDAMYWVMFAIFTLCTAAWGAYVYRHKAHAHKVHYIMFALIFFKAWTVLSQALMYYYIERTGSADGWNIAFYIFTFFRGILFFVVVVLIGTGWSYMKPFLGDKEKRIIMIVIPLQVFANVAIVITDEESPAVVNWFTWRDVFHLVDVICCCAILFPIVWSIKHLREASQTDGKAARNLEKLTLFRQFYVMVVVYIYFTRIVVYLLESTVDYKYSWLSDAADQLATLAFYVWTAVKFRPHDDNPYLKLTPQEMDP